MPPAVLAMSFALSVPGITSLVLGSETVEQVRQNASLAEQAQPLSPQQFQKIRQCFAQVDPRVINPSMW